MSAWFDGDTRAGARTIFDFRELIDKFPSVERQIRLLTTGSRSSYSFIGDKSPKIIKEALTTTERTIPLTIPTHPLISTKRHRKRHLNGLAYSSYRDKFGLGEKSRDVQVNGVGLGFGRDTEQTPIVTKVLPELARGDEISLAHVLVPYQSTDSDCLLFAVLNPLVGFPTVIKRLVLDTVKARTGGAKLYDWPDITPILEHVGITVILPKLDLTEDRLKGLIALQEGMFVVTYHGHAVGVDCQRRLIYDCAFVNAVELSNDGFVHCEIFAAQHVRRIVLKDSRIRKLLSGSKDAEFMKLLKAKMFALYCVV